MNVAKNISPLTQKLPAHTRSSRTMNLSSSQVRSSSLLKAWLMSLDFLHSHFKKRKIEDLLNEHTSGFTDTTLLVEVAAGACFKPLVVVANVFRPQTWELLGQHRLAIDQENQASRLVLQNSAPVGLLNISTAELKEKCRDHIEQMIKNKAYPGHISPVGATQIPYNVLWAAQRYIAASKVSDSSAWLANGRTNRCL